MSSVLAVPHIPQLADGYCLPACVQMVLSYWGTDRSQEQLARQLGMIPGAGTPGSRLHRMAWSGFSVHYGSGELEEIRSAIAQAVPPIALVNTKHFEHWTLETAHAVVIVAMGAERLILNDPGMNHGQTRVGIGDFVLAWDEMANLYGTLRPIA